MSLELVIGRIERVSLGQSVRYGRERLTVRDPAHDHPADHPRLGVDLELALSTGRILRVPQAGLWPWPGPRWSKSRRRRASSPASARSGPARLPATSRSSASGGRSRRSARTGPRRRPSARPCAARTRSRSGWPRRGPRPSAVRGGQTRPRTDRPASRAASAGPADWPDESSATSDDSRLTSTR